MILNLGSLAFNIEMQDGGGTPAWGTELGQGEGYRFNFEDTETFLTSLLYCSLPDKDDVVCPLGKGGKQQDHYERVIASLYNKVYVNGERVPDASFILLIVKLLVGNHHVGRRTIKYNPEISYHEIKPNRDCFKKIRNRLEIQNNLKLNDNSAWFISEMTTKNQDELHFTAHIINPDGKAVFATTKERKEALENLIGIKPKIHTLPLQRIYYGSPGTGKSHEVNEIAKRHPGRFIRTTFHPDSDYASFVGAYKPVTQKRGGQVRSDCSFGELAALLKKEYADAGSGKKVATLNAFVLKYADYFNGKISSFNKTDFCKEAGVSDEFHVEINHIINLHDWMSENGYLAKTDSITYSFVPQAFLKAYCNAWKALDEPYYLIIEEINRGNCAQIFGDLFQLLDRNADGLSKYGIEADDDIRRFIDTNTELGFGALTEEQKTAIRDAVSGSKDLENITAEDIISGKTLCLPPNLRILATMNTSDQSLFPMDSAFKRRWEWKYVPTTPPKGAEKSMRMEVKEEKTAYGKTVNVGSYTYSWTEFLDKINDRILQATHSEDKQLGFWFVGGDEVKEIPVSTFVSKVVFYLWNDVFKDFGAKESNPFSVNVDGKFSLMSFNKFFEINAEGDTVENLGVLHRFMGNVGLTPEPEEGPQTTEDDILANEGMDQDNGDTIDAQVPEASSANTEPAE